MPNGHDKNYRRLLMACAAYRARHREWPTHARFSPMVLRNLAHLFDDDSFERLALHLELRTTTEWGISVGGARGVVAYGTRDYVEPAPELVEQAERWLNLEVLRER